MGFMTKRLLISLSMATASMMACSSSEKPGTNTPSPQAAAGFDVDITVSSVHLGGDCPDPKPASPPVAPTANTAEKPTLAPAEPSAAAGSAVPAAKRAPGAMAERSAFAADCAGDGCGSAFCQQTSMQLELKATGNGVATKVEVIKVELLGQDGAVVSELNPRSPTKWNDATNVYEAWDGVVGVPGDSKTSYSLSSPNWEKVPGGRYGGGQGLAVRVTLAIGDKRVIKTAMAVSVMIDPQVVT